MKSVPAYSALAGLPVWLDVRQNQFVQQANRLSIETRSRNACSHKQKKQQEVTGQRGGRNKLGGGPLWQRHIIHVYTTALSQMRPIHCNDAVPSIRHGHVHVLSRYEKVDCHHRCQLGSK